ncbi:hypothetical protein [Clostridium tyrobutyricum]|jgi:hypothetical protein|uniref:Uncharacterized protein n=1 Tax=Clostridium tyrobutyricum DIVETGP TaxID=1408889 RepID=W6N2B1_CLOTY|nr:hypothetical protein [Clostridium tyrobutyricum]AND84801.1 hypothetical protein CTK_C15420 [Clostridium tyrobutyricum]MBR9647689.1 hypothetical protein [Clostridium tyrobutyricum]MBV4415983.1 hypothetical protein [Clostridium tyrobutyricum]MBV4422075.1 hypothetical protein [Clostridium tyrobutyricum]MBV4425610.1 hypothetical protein [Clostridium tyrobutyricum]
MYDIKDIGNSKESINKLRANCICDRSYFKQIKSSSIFELKSIHIPTENIIKY